MGEKLLICASRCAQRICFPRQLPSPILAKAAPPVLSFGSWERGGKTVKNKELMVKAEGLAGELSSRSGPSKYFYRALRSWLHFYDYYYFKTHPATRELTFAKKPRHVLLALLPSTAPWQGFADRSLELNPRFQPPGRLQ